MDDIKTKFLDLIHAQNRHMKIPSMGFSDYFVQNVSNPPETVEKKSKKADKEESIKLSDQEILESIDGTYFSAGYDVESYELKKFETKELNCDDIERAINILRQQQKVISKKVLHHILEQRSTCNEEFEGIVETEKELDEALWTCRKARSYLSFAKKNLTTTSLEILAAYRKREILVEVLKSLNTIKAIKTTDIELQKLLAGGNYSGAISLLLQCKESASRSTEYNCVQSLNHKLQETLILTEYQLDTVLNEMILNFDVRKYGELQAAYKLLNKALFAMDQLHINFISAIHTTVNTVLRSYNDQTSDDKQKLLFEQLCECVPTDKYIACLISLCKSFWTILASYYQISMWHQNYKLFQTDQSNSQDTSTYIQEKLKKGQYRIWSDIQSKTCVYLSSPKLKMLKYEQFIQVLAITQRLNKVGIEFCGETSDKLIDKMKAQSVEFFNRYHLSCLEEICLFLDNESWTPVDSFTNILQLQEFRSIRHSLQRHKSPPVEIKVGMLSNENSTVVKNSDESVSVHSQDGSSIYGSCGYFLRFSEKSSPFEGGLDATMLEEDILSGIVDEASCYFSEESEDEEKKISFQTRSEDEGDKSIHMLTNNTTLNVLRCVGKYLQMCKLLHCISPQIVASMLELIDFYIFAVHEIFAKDSPISMDNLYPQRLEAKLRCLSKHLVPKVKGWPLNFSSLANNELCNPDTLFGLYQRIVAIESGMCVVKQCEQLQCYLEHLLPVSERQLLLNYSHHFEFAYDISKPAYTCVTAKTLDLQGILAGMGKVKWDINHINVQHSPYINILNRSVQTFAMRLEEISKDVTLPLESIWDSLAHVSTHLIVEGFSNVKKCSAGGRALMQLDFTHFMSILELISGFKFPEHRAYVDNYIKAYYFPFELFEEWVYNHKDSNIYSAKQISNLILCVCANDKKKRQKLLAEMGNVSDFS